jgi:DNA-binding Lrp family transcriptional regulator
MNRLLQLLEQNGSLTPERLSQMTNVPPSEIREQIGAYEKEGIIAGYRAIINTNKIQNDRVKAVIEVRITPEREGGFDRSAERIAQFEEVSSCFLMSGGYDLLIFVEGRSLQEVASFVSSRLAPMDRVQSTATHFMLKVYKDQHILMTPSETEARIPVAP